ncbi:MAG TPA: PDZ domain-containing protein [Gemmatimonadaceae bacterium]|nr:PDZ domain-containing protein [Gemmatimonadaceae bacterium]
MSAAFRAQILASAVIMSVGFAANAAAQTPVPVPEAPPGWFGVTISDNAMVDDDLNAFFDSYPVVSKVEPRSPAAKAGVKTGDVLLKFDSHDMRGGAIQMKKWLKPGAPFVLQLRRDGQLKQVRGTLQQRPEGWKELAIVSITPSQDIELRARGIGGEPLPSPGRLMRTRVPSPEPLPSVLVPAMGYGGGVYPFAGAEFTALNDDLRDALGVKTSGVFVTNVMEGSPARTAGLRGGDIIVKADGTKVHGPFDLVDAIRNADSRNTTTHTIELQILRKSKPQTLTLRW